MGNTDGKQNQRIFTVSSFLGVGKKNQKKNHQTGKQKPNRLKCVSFECLFYFQKTKTERMLKKNVKNRKEILESEGCHISNMPKTLTSPA